MKKPERYEHITIIVAKWHQQYTYKLRDAAIAQLKKMGYGNKRIIVKYVPGSVELPLAAQHAAREPNCEGIIAFGCVIRGETTHYETVSHMSSMGLMRVMLDESLPVICGVLTVENTEQAEARCSAGPLDVGTQSAIAAVEMIHGNSES